MRTHIYIITYLLTCIYIYISSTVTHELSSENFIILHSPRYVHAHLFAPKAMTTGGIQATAQLLLSDFAMRAARHLKLEVNPGAEFAAAAQCMYKRGG